jgi:hypothetical protein
MKNRTAGVLLQAFMFIACATFVMIMSAKWNFKAGPLALEGYYFFGYIGNKPYAKFTA